MKKKWVKRGIAAVLTALMIVTSIPITAMKTEAGTISGLITMKYSEIILDYVERVSLTVLSNGAKANEGTELGEVLGISKKLLASSLGNSLGAITSLCEEILAEVQVIEAKLDECNRTLTKLETSTNFERYQSYRSKLISFKNTYTELYNDFTKYLNALLAYENDKTQANFDAMQLAYYEIEDLYLENPNVLNGEYTSLDFNFVNDLNAFLLQISPYLPSQEINTNAFPYEQDYWGSDQGTTTYIDALYTCARECYPYEHLILEQMKAGTNEVAGIASLYISVLRLYTEVGAQIIARDGALTEEQREKELSLLWSSFEENAYKLIRGLEQMCADANQYTDGYMTHLDSNVTIEMDPEEFYYAYKTFPNDEEISIIMKEDQIINDKLEFYQVKSPDLDYTYAILKGKSENTYADGTELSGSDLAEIVNEESYLYGNEEYYGVSGDYLKLTRSNPDNNNVNYIMLENQSDLSGLIAGNLFNGDVYQYLSGFLGTDLPAKTDGMMIPLYTHYDNWNPTQAGTERDMDLPVIDISSNVDALNINASVKKLDTKEDLTEGNRKDANPLIILKSTKHSHTLTINSVDDPGEIIVTDENGKVIKNLDTVTSGTKLTVKLLPYSDGTIDSVCLRRIDDSNKIIYDDEPYYLAGSADISEGLLGELMEMVKNEDGYYTFSFTMPYTDTALCVDFASENPWTTYNFTLDGGEHGTMQFLDSPGITEKSVKPGEEVYILVRPDSGYLVSKISGTLTPIAVSDTDYHYAPNMKVYKITMPEKDVTYEAVYEAAYLAELNTVNAGEGCAAEFVYENSDNWDEDWLTNTGTFASGSKVSLKTTNTQKYYVSEIVITDYDSYDYINANINGDIATFTMPAGNIGIDVKFEQVVARSYTASISKEGEGTVYFLNEDGDTVNSSQLTFEEGSTVTIEATPTHAWAGDLSIKDHAGNEIEYTDLGNKQYSFVMPGSNVSILAPFAKQIEVEIEQIPDYGALVYFKDSYYETQQMFWENDTITLRLNDVLFQAGCDVRINNCVATDSEGNNIPVTKVSGKEYQLTAGKNDIYVELQYDTLKYCYFTEGLAEDNMGFQVLSNPTFPGLKVVFYWIGDVPKNLEVYAKDAAGNSVPVTDDSDGYYSLIMPDSDVYITAEIYENGICTACGKYQVPNLNKAGYYEITNAGELMWFNYMVNGIDSELADYDESNPAANAVLMNNIDMSDISEVWIRLGANGSGYKGTFDGNGFTIYNLKLDEATKQQVKERWFAHLKDGGIVKNLFIKIADMNEKVHISVSTGDYNTLWIYIVLICLSGTMIYIVYRKRKYKG